MDRLHALPGSIEITSYMSCAFVSSLLAKIKDSFISSRHKPEPVFDDEENWAKMNLILIQHVSQ